MTFIAHTKNGLGQRQDLLDHLHAVADLAAAFAAPFGASELAYLAGIFHDIGKFNPAFQQYLLDAEAGHAKRGSGPDHKGAGAILAAQLHLTPLTFLVAGHHGGLPSSSSLRQDWLPTRSKDSAIPQAIQEARRHFPALTTIDPIAKTPGWLTQATPHTVEFFIRILFSALIDADFLDTERHFMASALPDRGQYPSIDDLWQQFQANQQQLSGQQDNELNRIRHEVYTDCLAATEHSPGFFRLTVPTGGGKTRSSLAFGLAHARVHHLRRVIYAIPYMSITEQTADVFREIFSNNPQAVLEHHSGVVATDPDNPTLAETWAKLASENWDAPLIVTTTVQLFESLLAQKTSPCRKLHAIAGSVIILDEVQTLPPHLLTTILDVLRELVDHYHVSVVLCTATQPALDDQPDFQGLPDVREIVPDSTRLFSSLKRVIYHWPSEGELWSWERVAEQMHQGNQALAIVNTRRDAAALLVALNDPDALHLSTWMCGAHRRAVLAQAHQRLRAHQPCLLVSTQLIEAGVDIDFPLVLRALGPLDSLVQAAGRCNREGTLAALGNVWIFQPEEGGIPPGAYRIGTDVTRSLLAKGDLDLHDPNIYQRYFRDYYAQLNRDAREIQALRQSLDYPEVAARFRMIDDDSQPVVVRFAPHVEAVEMLLEQLHRTPGKARLLLRQLHPYMVNVRQRDIQRVQRQGLITEIPEVPGVWEWLGTYDDQRGIVLEAGLDPGNLYW